MTFTIARANHDPEAHQIVLTITHEAWARPLTMRVDDTKTQAEIVEAVKHECQRICARLETGRELANSLEGLTVEAN